MNLYFISRKSGVYSRLLRKPSRYYSVFLVSTQTIKGGER